MEIKNLSYCFSSTKIILEMVTGMEMCFRNCQRRSVAMFWQRSRCAFCHCHPTMPSALFLFAIKLTEPLVGRYIRWCWRNISQLSHIQDIGCIEICTDSNKWSGKECSNVLAEILHFFTNTQLWHGQSIWRWRHIIHFRAMGHRAK